MNVRTMTLAGVALVAVVALAVLGTWRWAQATGPDVNNDGTVNIIDIGHVVQSFMQQVPLPHKAYLLAEGVVVNAGGSHSTAFVDTRGCSNFTLTARWSVTAPNNSPGLQLSADGVVGDGFLGGASVVTTDATQVRVFSNGGGAPFASAVVFNDGAGTRTLNALYLYCTP